MDNRKAEAAYHKPDYRAEFEVARETAQDAIDSIEYLDVVETLADNPDIDSEAAAQRIADLLGHFTPRINPDTANTYKMTGEV